MPFLKWYGFFFLRPLRLELDVIQKNCRVRIVGISQHAYFLRSHVQVDYFVQEAWPEFPKKASSCYISPKSKQTLYWESGNSTLLVFVLLSDGTKVSCWVQCVAFWPSCFLQCNGGFGVRYIYMCTMRPFIYHVSSAKLQHVSSWHGASFQNCLYWDCNDLFWITPRSQLMLCQLVRWRWY
jgi:hypothetical protein